MSRLNKRGVSILVGYVILVAIAISLATAVFFYLKLYLPSDEPECYDDIDLVIDEATCVKLAGGTISNVHVEISNRGFFNVDAAYIKIGDSDRILRTTLNDPEADRMVSSCNNYEVSLKPGSTFCDDFTYSAAPTVMQEISIEPLIWIDNKPILCPDSIVTKNIMCT